LQQPRAMTGNTERFGLAGNQEIVPLVQESLSSLKVERRRLPALDCYIALQMTLQAEVVGPLTRQTPGVNKLC